MGVLDKFLSAIKLNDEEEDYLDDDILDDDEDFLDDEEPEERPKNRFFSKFGSRKKASKADDDYDDELRDLDDDFDDEDDDFEEEDDYDEPAPVSKKHPVSKKSEPAASSIRSRTSRNITSIREEKVSKIASSPKITPMRQSRRSGNRSNSEVSVIRPLSMENTREIADRLMEYATVVLNLEGLDVELAQRIIDFASGSCYSLGGTLQKVSSYIFILGPSNVDITGDLQSILGYSEPSVRAGY